MARTNGYVKAMCAGRTFELWECTRFFNPRPRLGVYVTGNRRFRGDTEQVTSIEKLKAEGWRLYHRMPNYARKDEAPTQDTPPEGWQLHDGDWRNDPHADPSIGF